MGLHATAYPETFYTKRAQVPRRTIDSYMLDKGLQRDKYNCLNLDIQGTELSALKGASTQLQHVDYVYTEVNTEPLYQGSCTLSEIDAYLASFGFARITTIMTDQGWGDAFYARGAAGTTLADLGGRSNSLSIRLRRLLSRLG